LANPNTYRIVLVPHDPAWAVMFCDEATRIAPAFGRTLCRIEHIGSTAIPGIKAKPLIDLLAIVRDIREVDRLTARFVALGYDARGDLGITGRRLFTKRDFYTPTHNVHCYQEGDPEIGYRLKFADYLRAHPPRAAEYSLLKESLAQKFPKDITSYVRGKTSFVKETLRLADAWQRQHQPATPPLDVVLL
jgi:GrpB-like predicted nucleotidyltransferase (UPF0157 family)